MRLRPIAFMTLLLPMPLLAGQPLADSGAPKAAQAVRVGLGGPALDACMSTGEVAAGDPAPVRVAPNAMAPERDRLAPGFGFAICDESGEWTGIIYGPAGLARHCGTASPVPRVTAYAGRCRSGWIATDRVRMMAG
jgi:hypothetical protein